MNWDYRLQTDVWAAFWIEFTYRVYDRTNKAKLLKGMKLNFVKLKADFDLPNFTS